LGDHRGGTATVSRRPSHRQGAIATSTLGMQARHRPPDFGGLVFRHQSD
jgi:hypothetical protein